MDKNAIIFTVELIRGGTCFSRTIYLVADGITIRLEGFPTLKESKTLPTRVVQYGLCKTHRIILKTHINVSVTTMNFTHMIA